MVTRAVTLGFIASIFLCIAYGTSGSIVEQKVIATESFGLAFAKEQFRLSYDVFDNPPKFFGDKMIITSPRKTVDNVPGAGSMSIIDTESNSLLYTINNPEPNKNEMFGRNVGTSDSYIMVGIQEKTPSTYDNNHVAKIYVFEGTTGKLLHTINSPHEKRESYVNFHSSFSHIDSIGDNIVAGFYIDDFPRAPTHVIHVFDGKSGKLLRTINSPIPKSVSFGEVLETFDGKIATYMRDENPNDQKIDDAIHVFDGKTGELLYTINDPNTNTKGDFGRNFIIVNDNIVVGVPVWGSDNRFSGIIHIFDGKTGTLLSTINDPKETPRDFDRQFGESIVPAGNNIATRSNDAVYIFDGSTGGLLHTVDSQNLSNVELDKIVDLLEGKDNIMTSYFFFVLGIAAIIGAAGTKLSEFKIRK